VKRGILPIEVPKYITYFNDSLLNAVYPSDGNIDPIASKEIQPKRIDKHAEVHEYWVTDEARKMLMAVKRLRFGTSKDSLTITDREKEKWIAELTESLGELETWQGNQERSEADFFHQKCILLKALVDLIPVTNPQRENILRAFVNHLEMNRVQQESWIEWYRHVRDALVLFKSQDHEKTKLLDLFNNSKDNTLRLLVRIEKIQLSKKRS
jgi:hypothetical protein